jgi:Protein of unknown function (DUF3795)
MSCSKAAKRRKNMEEMIAFCGLNCAECPAFLATQENDDEKENK